MRKMRLRRLVVTGKAGKKAKVEIADDVLLVKTTMSRPDTATLLALVAANFALLQREWKKLRRRSASE
jgi:hypothetical protein